MGTEDTCSSLFSQNPHLGKSKAGKFALSMGLVNLPAGFFGTAPMHYGTGGLAAHYRLGAASGGAPVMIGHFLKQKSDLDLTPIDPTPPPHQSPCLDPVELDRLERHYRRWADESLRRDVRLARRRILLIFLLIRYTGAKLSEILTLDPYADIEGKMICIHDSEPTPKTCLRKIAISENPAQEIQALLSGPEFKRFLVNRFAVDPAFIRRKFYECAEACVFAKRIGGPEMIRRARAVELIHGNIPLPAVQRLLGLSSQNLRTADISYTEEELQRVTQFYVERESLRKTSARNTFLGKITHILRGDIQAQLLLQYVLFFLEHKKQHRAHEKSGLTCSV